MDGQTVRPPCRNDLHFNGKGMHASHRPLAKKKPTPFRVHSSTFLFCPSIAMYQRRMWPAAIPMPYYVVCISICRGRRRCLSLCTIALLALLCTHAPPWKHAMGGFVQVFLWWWCSITGECDLFAALFLVPEGLWMVSASCLFFGGGGAFTFLVLVFVIPVRVRGGYGGGWGGWE